MDCKVDHEIRATVGYIGAPVSLKKGQTIKINGVDYVICDVELGQKRDEIVLILHYLRESKATK
jgi:hypothetical protein